MRTGKNVINDRWAYINPYNNISRYNTGPNTFQIQFNIDLFHNTIQSAVTQQYTCRAGRTSSIVNSMGEAVPDYSDETITLGCYKKGSQYS